MLALFNVAFECQQNRHGETKKRDEIEQQRNHYLAKAKELRDDARMISDLSFDMKRCLALETAAQAYEDHANEGYATGSATALERQHDGRPRWVILTLIDAVRAQFGSPMYGLTATIASVILGREITPRRVQHCARYAVKSPKIV